MTDTIPTDTPKYKPDGSINKLSVSYSGSTVDDCTVTAALTVNEPQMETPSIYRIEVLGTVGTNEYVFAYEDVLTSAGNTVTANFRDLPKEYFAENVTNRRVRAWYAASGLGPVYTYGDIRQTGDAPLRCGLTARRAFSSRTRPFTAMFLAMRLTLQTTLEPRR